MRTWPPLGREQRSMLVSSQQYTEYYHLLCINVNEKCRTWTKYSVMPGRHRAQYTPCKTPRIRFFARSNYQRSQGRRPTRKIDNLSWAGQELMIATASYDCEYRCIVATLIEALIRSPDCTVVAAGQQNNLTIRRLFSPLLAALAAHTRCCTLV